MAKRKKLDVIKFDSIYAMGEHVKELHTRNDERQLGDGSTMDESGPRSMDYGNCTPREAQEIASNGGNWSGAKMPYIAVPHETLSGAPLPQLNISSDIQGFGPNVPAYLAGTPDSMLYADEIEGENKVLRVGVHVGRIADTTQEQVLNRGAAIMAVLAQLQQEGYAVELTAVWRNSDTVYNPSIETVIKGAQDFWSPDAVAFALAHVAFQRRLCWRIVESMPDSYGITTGYGRGSSGKLDGFDISYGYMTESVQSACDSPERAVALIKKQTLKQLKELNQPTIEG